jgi:Carboxypeptidase regulatory-like domain
MLRLIRWFSPVVCLIALAVFASHMAKADDAATSQPSGATSQPSAATGSIVVTVLDSDSNPVVKARVQLYPKKKPSDSDDAGAAPAKPKAIARAYTGDDGKFTFENVAPGDYKVNASFKKTGSKGSASTSVTADALNPEITITFAAPSTDNGGGATTAPSTPPAQ